MTDQLPGRVLSLVTADPAEFELALRPWELLSTPERGVFSHHVEMLQTARFIMYREKYGLPMRIQGLTPPEMVGIGVPIGIGQEAIFWGQTHAGHSMPATMPGALDAEIKGGHGQYIIFIHIPTLQGVLSPPLLEAFLGAARGHNVSVPEHRLRIFGDWVRRTLDSAVGQPSLFAEPAVMNSVFRELLDHIVLLAAAVAPRTDLSFTNKRQRGLDRALEYLRNNREYSVSLPELSAIAEVSERSLQYAFQDAFDMTPSEFMFRRRLHAVRQNLIGAHRTSINITRVATEHGFFELGRFANRYRRHFGEKPSDTLKRPMHQ